MSREQFSWFLIVLTVTVILALMVIIELGLP
jgi:hypothetical protein